MFKGRKIFFKNIDIDYLVCVFHKEKGSAAKKDNSRLMISSTKSQGNTKGFNRTSRYIRIF